MAGLRTFGHAKKHSAGFRGSHRTLDYGDRVVLPFPTVVVRPKEGEANTDQAGSTHEMNKPKQPVAKEVADRADQADPTGGPQEVEEEETRPPHEE
jgi:hypothetical protein